jgi:hypothetical protein
VDKAGMYVRKKVEAKGRFCARSEGIWPGLLIRPGRAAMIPELMVTIKNECCHFIDTSIRRLDDSKNKHIQ